MKREVCGAVAALAIAVVMAGCSSPAGPTSMFGGGSVNVLASVADTVIGDAHNSCPSDTPTGLEANANNGKVDFAANAVVNVSRYVFRIERRDSVIDTWGLVQDYTVDGKPLFTLKLAKGLYRVSVRTPCMAAGAFSKSVEFSS